MSDTPHYTESMNRLIDRLSKLPGIGRRTAERLAFHILKDSKEQGLALARAIREVKENVRNCSACFNLTEEDPCPICADPERDPSKILVVEQPRDVINFEQSRSYSGLYHVLLGRLAPLEGIGPGELTVGPLVQRVRRLVGEHGNVEIILGTNPNMEGDGTALYVAEQLEGIEGVSVTRLARGLPAGSQLEYANKAVLSDAINSRRAMS